MRQSDGLFDVLLGKSRAAPVLALVAAALLSAGGARAASPTEPAVHLKFTIPVKVAATNKTGGMYSFDISWVDQATQTFYLADRSNQAIDVADAKTGKFIKQITATPPFAGASPGGPELSGPNGVLTTTEGCIIATDAGNRVVSFNASGTQVKNIHLSKAVGRADELAFDPRDNLLLIITPVPNGTANPPAPTGTLVTVGSGCDITKGKTITFSFATNGAEQPVWDKATGLFYLAIPQIGTDPTDGLVVGINPTTAHIVKFVHVKPCSPNGLALNPKTGELLLGCGVVPDTAGNMWDPTAKVTAAPLQLVLDPKTGAMVKVKGVGASDEVTYNAQDNHFYTGSSGSPYSPSVVVSGATPVSQGANILGVIDGTSLGVDQLVPTFGVPKVVKGTTTVHPGGSGHSVAANDTNGWVFVPGPANNAIPNCLKGCIQVFVRHDNDTD